MNRILPRVPFLDVGSARWALVLAAGLCFGCRFEASNVKQNPAGRWFGKREVLTFEKGGVGTRAPRRAYPDGKMRFSWSTQGDQIRLSPGGTYTFQVVPTFSGIKLVLKDSNGRKSEFNYD